MRFLLEIEETVTRLRKVIVESESIEEAEEIISSSIGVSKTSEELYNNLKSNKSVIEIKEHDYEGYESEITYINEYSKYKEERNI